MRDVKEPPLADFSRNLPYRVSRLAAALNRGTSRIVGRFGDVSLVEWRVLMLLTLSGVDTISAMAAASQFDKGLLSRAVTSLAARGLILQENDERDRRVTRLSISPEAREILARVEPVIRNRNRALAADLSEDDLARLIDLLEALERRAILIEDGAPDFEDLAPGDRKAGLQKA